jgi:hypothetical protein
MFRFDLNRLMLEINFIGLDLNPFIYTLNTQPLT